MTIKISFSKRWNQYIAEIYEGDEFITREFGITREIANQRIMELVKLFRASL